MADFNAILQDLVDRDYPSLLKLARQMRRNCTEIVARYSDSAKASNVVRQFLCAILFADGNESAREQRFVEEVLRDDQPQRPLHVVKYDVIDMLDALIDMMTSEEKASFIVLAAAVFASDESIRPAEMSVLKKLIQ